MPGRLQPNIPMEEPATEPPGKGSIIAGDGSVAPPEEALRGAGRPVDVPQGEAVEQPPDDEHPEHDCPFTKHAGVWFKGKYEIQDEPHRSEADACSV